MKTFNELELSPELMRALTEQGYDQPTPIQAEALPILLGQPTDFLGLAATGTGKTAAFAIPLLEKINPSKRATQAVVICPTRELALQVSGQINLLGKYKGVQALPIYGGADYAPQIRGLKDQAAVVVGTPGRILDHIERGTLNLKGLEVLVLDEADEMISMGFKEDLEAILSQSPRESSQIWLFSATMSPEVKKVANEYLSQPQQVQINRTEMLPKTVEQIYYMTSESNKPEVLCKLIDAADDFYGIVFCQTKALVTDLTQYLTQRRYKVDCLHGDKDQKPRETTLQAFRTRKVNLLICTDVASRGLDVKDVTHVINYSLPRELDNYVHRIGRTARNGKTGFALNLVTPSHRGLIGRIEKMTKSRMHEGTIPTRKEIGAKKISQILTKFQSQDSHARAVELLNPEWKTSLAQMEREEIAGRLLSMMFPEVFLANYDREESQPKNSRAKESRSGDSRERNFRGDRNSRGNRNPKESWNSKDSRPSRNSGDFKDFRKPQDSNGSKGSKDFKEFKGSRNFRDFKDSKGPRDFGGFSRGPKGPRGPKDSRSFKDSRGSRPGLHAKRKPSQGHHSKSQSSWT